MKLAAFYQAIGPFLEGKQGHEATVRALWGDAAPARDAERLAIYGRFCRVHRFEAVDSLYSETRAALIGQRGEPFWEALVEGYFTAHPMHHWELNENSAELAGYLRGEAPAHQLPAWLPELAELEWWEWRTRIAPDDPRDREPEQGPLRLASTVELRPFAHDLCDWLDAAGSERAPAPAAEPTLVLFWRDGDLKSRRGLASPEELQILKAAHEGAPIDPRGPLAETLEDLRAARILLGAP